MYITHIKPSANELIWILFLLKSYKWNIKSHNFFLNEKIVTLSIHNSDELQSDKSESVLSKFLWHQWNWRGAADYFYEE